MRLIKCPKPDEMYTFRREDGTNTVEMTCTAASSVYVTDKARRLDLNVSAFASEVQEIEAFVSEYLQVPVRYGGVQNEVLKGVKIPCRYGHVMIPITDAHGYRITTFDITENDSLRVVMELRTVWRAQHFCGLTWVLQSIKKA